MIDILRACHEDIVGIMDDFVQAHEWYGFPVLGGNGAIYSVAEKYPTAKWLVAIGDNDTRMNIVQRLKCAAVQFGIAVHPSAVVADDVCIGEGTVVMPNAVIQVDASIGEHVIVNTAATIDHDCKVGNYVHISPGVHMAGGVEIGEGSHIGIGAALIPGVCVGSHTTVGAASCVIRNLPDQVTAVGCPAKVIKKQ